MTNGPLSGNGDLTSRLRKMDCPICHKDEWTLTPVPVSLPAVDGSGKNLHVRPAICNNCGFVMLLLSPTQPGLE